MWGAELPSRPGLALEALDDELVEHQPGRDHLERDEPARAFVDREVDRPHAAHPDKLHDPVFIVDDLADDAVALPCGHLRPRLLGLREGSKE